MMGAVESREGRARAGEYKSAWTVKEAVEKGLMVIVNASRLINQPLAQYYFVTQVYSFIIQEMNKRIPNNPNDKPVVIILDETYALTGIPGMAEEIAKVPSLYRSRKVELYIVLQALSQLSPNLRNKSGLWVMWCVLGFRTLKKPMKSHSSFSNTNPRR